MTARITYRLNGVPQANQPQQGESGVENAVEGAAQETAQETSSDLRGIFVRIGEIDFLQMGLYLLVGVVLSVALRRFFIWLSNQVATRFRFYVLPLVPITRTLVVVVVGYLIIQELIDFSNVSPQNILAIVGAASVAIGFAFKDYISSIIAGVVAVYERPYRLGDWIKIDGDYGEVQSLGLRAVKILTPDDTMVSIPHQKLWTVNVANANDGQREHMCVANFYLHPEHDSRLVRQTLEDVVVTSPYTQLARKYIVIVLEKPWGTQYRLKAYPIDGRDEFDFVSDLTVRGREALADIGARHALSPSIADSASGAEG